MTNLKNPADVTMFDDLHQASIAISFFGHVRFSKVKEYESFAKYVQQYYKLTVKAWDIVLFIFENRSNGVTIYNYTNRVK